jgi:hypothetical protein
MLRRQRKPYVDPPYVKENDPAYWFFQAERFEELANWLVKNAKRRNGAYAQDEALICRMKGRELARR